MYVVCCRTEFFSKYLSVLLGYFGQVEASGEALSDLSRLLVNSFFASASKHDRTGREVIYTTGVEL